MPSAFMAKAHTLHAVMVLCMTQRSNCEKYGIALPPCSYGIESPCWISTLPYLAQLCMQSRSTPVIFGMGNYITLVQNLGMIQSTPVLQVASRC